VVETALGIKSNPKNFKRRYVEIAASPQITKLKAIHSCKELNKEDVWEIKKYANGLLNSIKFSNGSPLKSFNIDEFTNSSALTRPSPFGKWLTTYV
jgi:hypothetical protein